MDDKNLEFMGARVDEARRIKKAIRDSKEKVEMLNTKKITDVIIKEKGGYTTGITNLSTNSDKVNELLEIAREEMEEALVDAMMRLIGKLELAMLEI